MNVVALRLRRFLAALYCELIPGVIRPRVPIGPERFRSLLKQHSAWLSAGAEPSNSGRLVLFHRDLRQAGLRDADLRGAILIDCDLRAADLSAREDGEERYSEREPDRRFQDVALDYSQLRGARLNSRSQGRRRPIDLSGASFVGTNGMFGTDSASFGQEVSFDPARLPRLQRWGHPRDLGDFPSWETMKLLGTLPVLSVSNLLIGGILVYSAIASWYNTQTERLLAHAVAPDADTLLVQIANILAPAPASAHLGNVLMALVTLTLTNILYRVQCPTLVQEYSRWSVFGRGEYERSQRLTYLSATYSRPLFRYVCFLAMVGAGGLGGTA